MNRAISVSEEEIEYLIEQSHMCHPGTPTISEIRANSFYQHVLALLKQRLIWSLYQLIRMLEEGSYCADEIVCLLEDLIPEKVVPDAARDDLLLSCFHYIWWAGKNKIDPFD